MQHSADHGVANSEMDVNKFIENISTRACTDFHIDLFIVTDGVLIPSPHTDGVSFDAAR